MPDQTVFGVCSSHSSPVTLQHGNRFVDRSGLCVRTKLLAIVYLVQINVKTTISACGGRSTENSPMFGVATNFVVLLQFTGVVTLPEPKLRKGLCEATWNACQLARERGL